MALVPTGKDILVEGNEYVISIYRSAEVITVITPAEVRLRHWDPSNANQKFVCTRTDKNWLGLRSVGTGKYLGRDSFKNLGCAATSQSEPESFVFRQAEHGGSAMFVQSDGRFYRTFRTSNNGGPFLGTDPNPDAAVVGFTRVYA